MKKLYTLILCTLFITSSRAQQMFGIANSNYAGTLGVSLNPSSMVSSRLKLDVNLLTGATAFDNNYIYQPEKELKFFGFNTIFNNFGKDKKGTGYTDKKNWDEHNLSQKYSGYFNSKGSLPMVMFNVMENYFTVSLFTVRSVVSANDIPAP